MFLQGTAGELEEESSHGAQVDDRTPLLVMLRVLENDWLDGVFTKAAILKVT